MAARLAVLALLVACALGAWGLLSARPVEASPPAYELQSYLAALPPMQAEAILAALPAGIPLEMMQIVPGVGPAFVDSFSVSCLDGVDDTDGGVEVLNPIQPSGGAMVSYTCQNSSTTKVAVGDSGIGDPTSAQNSPIYCATNCPSQEWGGNARKEYCRADTGAVTIYCRALVAVGSAP